MSSSQQACNPSCRDIPVQKTSKSHTSRKLRNSRKHSSYLRGEHRGPILFELSEALALRYADTRNHEDLDRSINILNEAVDLHPSENPERGMHLLNILETIIPLQTAMSFDFPLDHTQHVMSLRPLASALHGRCNILYELDDLGKAITAFADVRALCLPDDAERVMLLNAFANGSGTRYRGSRNRQGLEKMMRLSSQALCRGLLF